MSTTCARSALDRFSDLGYAGPYPVLSREEASRYATGAWKELGVDPAASGPSTARLAAWHHHLPWAWELATHPAILDRIEALLGPDLVLWAMFCWYKPPRVGKGVPWHQDGEYWPIEPKRNVTAWVALEPTRRANGCLRLIPGSHRSPVAHSPVTDARSWFSKGATTVDERTAVDVEMEAGEAVFFTESTLHGSDPNDSHLPRLACSLRYTTPDVRIDPEGWGDDGGRIRTFLVRGEDRFHLNDTLRGIPPK